MTDFVEPRKRGRPAFKLYPVQASITLKAEQARRLDKLADAEGVSRSHIVRGLVDTYLDRYADAARKRRNRG